MDDKEKAQQLGFEIARRLGNFYGKDYHEQQEFTQIGRLKTLKVIKKYGVDNPVLDYLLKRSITREIYSEIRRLRRIHQKELEELNFASSANDRLDAMQLELSHNKALIKEAWPNLSGKEKKLVKWISKGYTLEEAGNMEFPDIPLETLKTRLFRMRYRMCKQFDIAQNRDSGNKVRKRKKK